jgi:MFS family permease
VAPHADLIKQTAYTLLIFTVAALPGYFLAAWTIDRLGRRLVQAGGFCFMALAFACLWLIPGATSTVSLFLILFGATYFFAEFGPTPRRSTIRPRSSRCGCGQPATASPPPERSARSSGPTR